MFRSVAILLIAALVPLAHGEEPCAVTPAAAADSILTGSIAEPAKSGGYRVQDLQADTVQRRVWIRIRRCNDAAAPLILLPLHASLHALEPSANGAASVVATSSQPLKPKPVLVHAGQPVTAVFATGTTHMEMQATANAQGSEGDRIEITLKRRAGQSPDEPEHIMHGTVRADSTVEVQP